MSALGNFGERLVQLSKFGRVVIGVTEEKEVRLWSFEVEVDGFVVGHASGLAPNSTAELLLESMKRKPLSDCETGKFKIPTEAEAEEAATSLTRKNLRQSRSTGRTAARAYQCPKCSAWHLTSMPPRTA